MRRQAPPHRSLAVVTLAAILCTTGCTSMVAAPEGERLLELQSAAPAAEPLPAEFEVVVWNIKKTQKKERWTKEFSSFDADADLMLLQEGYGSEIFSEAYRGSSDEWRMGVSFNYVSDGGAKKIPTGVVTLAPVASTSATVQHSPTREPFVPTPKAVLLTEYPLRDSEETLLVINVHAINFRVASYLSKQLEQLRAPIERHVGPVILAGDFNTHHGPRLDTLEDFADSLGLTAVFPNRKANARGKLRLVKDGRMRHGRYPLDHVYLRGLTASDAEVHEASKGSDHKPMSFRAGW